MDNNRKLCLYIATSLDGYIATEDDSLDWLFKIESEGDGGYSDFYKTVDTILIGRRTYDWIMTHTEGKFPYENKECYIFSNTITGKNDFVEFVNEDVTSFMNKLKSKKGKNIWLVGGGELIHHFLIEKLVDEFIISVAPTIIGKGIPLFKEADYKLELTLKVIKRYNQFSQLHYELK